MDSSKKYNTSESAEKLTRAFKDKEAISHPIERHPLSGFDFHIQDLYFTMLCILANFDTVVNERQTQFLKRLLVGTNSNFELIDFFKKAVSVPEDFPDKIVEALGNTNLKYNLILDLMLLLGLSNEKTDKQIELISETALILNISVGEVILCTKITKGIIEQDKRIIASLTEENNNLLEHFICYIREFYQGVISFSDDLIYLFCDNEDKIHFNTLIKDKKVLSDKEELFQNSLQSNLDLDKNIEARIKDIINLSADRIIIEGYILENEEIQIAIKNSKEVTFINCEFVKINIIPIDINKSREVSFDNCKFRDLTLKAISFNSGTELKINNCIFSNCSHYQLIDFESVDNIYIENNVFNKITFRQLSEGIFTIREWADVFVIKENKFISCKNLSKFGPLLLFSNKNPEESETITIDSNEFENCFANSVIKSDGLKPINYSNNTINNNLKFI